MPSSASDYRIFAPAVASHRESGSSTHSSVPGVHNRYTRPMARHTAAFLRSKPSFHLALVACLCLFVVPFAKAYSVQSHQQLVDLSWKQSMVPLLLARYPGLTEAELQEAHAYAYGGCAIQDLGYYPFGDEFFSNLLHYVRSGEFVQALLRDSQSADELAFSLGALSHYVGDSIGHSVATNFAVPVEFPKLGKQYGPWVTYDQDPHAHVQAEFAFDVNQISKNRFAPPDYLEAVGLQVPLPLLSRAFQETYGIPLHDVLGGSQHPNLFGYQTSVHHVLPRIAAAEALLHEKDMPSDTAGPEFDRMVHDLAQSGLDNGWNRYRSPAGIGTHVLAGLVYLTPKIGAPTMLAIKGPTVQTEQDYVTSLNRSIAAMHSIVADLHANSANASRDLPNRDLDTGREVQPGAYRLTDSTYQRLLARLTRGPTYPVPLGLRRNIEAFFSKPEAFGSHISAKQWQTIHEGLAQLQELPVPACEDGQQSPQSSPCSLVPSQVTNMFFDNWGGLLRVLIVGVCAYSALVLMLRVSGKRTLSKMNVFDLVVTVALGSTLASIVVSKGVALAEGLLAFAVLISLQFLVAWLSVRSKLISRLVKADPRMLFFEGQFMASAMRSERVTQVEVLAAIRAAGVAEVDHVGAVVLETDGSFTVLGRAGNQNLSSLRSVEGFPHDEPLQG